MKPCSWNWDYQEKFSSIHTQNGDKATITPCWLSHTWQYLLELGIQLDTYKMAFQEACTKDSFLMLNFWNASYWGETLTQLNKCCLWLQVTTVVDITNGQGQYILETSLEGIHMIIQPKQWCWPKQGQPPSSWWELWHQAVTKTTPSID